MADIDIFQQLRDNLDDSHAISDNPEIAKREMMIKNHRAWLKTFKRECPNPLQMFNVGVYIRYFNQTKYENYLDYHIMRFTDVIEQCPNWNLIDFYVDESSVAPKMASSPEWSRLMTDAMDGKVNLILTQRVKNISNDINEITFCSRMLAASTPPIGIYFIDEDIFTLASYYQHDLHDRVFFPDDDWKCLPDDTLSLAEPEEGWPDKENE